MNRNSQMHKMLANEFTKKMQIRFCILMITKIHNKLPSSYVEWSELKLEMAKTEIEITVVWKCNAFET